jgi:catechol 2,3-dioxygenase-like lactoylglutathione lyase family enzyme
MWIRDRLGGVTDGLVAVAAMGVLYHAALVQVIWEDFFTESAPATQRLMAGDLHGFLALAPAYGGSLLLGAPALALGGAEAGAPGPRQAAMTAYYGAFIFDPDGNKIEAVTFPR